jgi:hypothetical protein
LAKRGSWRAPSSKSKKKAPASTGAVRLSIVGTFVGRLALAMRDVVFLGDAFARLGVVDALG